MRRIFISDLHLCDRTAAEDFHHTLEFISFIGHYVLGNVDELYIVGDFFELWQAPLQTILVAHREPISALTKIADKGTKVTYIFGNHDYWFSYFKNPYPILFKSIVESYSVKGKLSIWVEHGHAYDMHNRTGAWTGKMITAIGGILERIVDPDIDQKALEALKEVQENFKKIISFIPPADPNYPGDKSEYDEAAKEKLIKENYDIVIFGHTHEPKIERIEEGKIYANTGSWVTDEPTFVEVTDTEVCLYKWIKGRAELKDRTIIR